LSASQLHRNLAAIINAAKDDGLTYNEVLGPLVYLTSSIGAAAAIQTGSDPDVVVEIIHHEIDYTFSGVLDAYRSQAA
jgi:hypothetical protein